MANTTTEALFYVAEKLKTLGVTRRHIANALLYIGSRGGKRYSSIADRLGIPVCTAGRTIKVLAGPGLGLVRVFRNPVDRREKLVYLTSKGSRFVSSCIETIIDAKPKTGRK